MDHHAAHGGSDEHMCNMNMVFTWDATDLCIIFRSWQVRSRASLVASLLAVVILTAGYELVREISRRYESAGAGAAPAVGLQRDEDEENESSSLLRPGRSKMWAGGRRRSRIVKALLYAVQVFYSFFIMLLFMTYNGWIMLAVAVGAFVGYLAFGNSSATKTVACH